jgi:hypothetical protein
MEVFDCAKCGIVKPVQVSGGTGYAIQGDGSKVCYDCCAELDKQTLILEGNSDKLPLYLSKDSEGWKVSNWPGTLTFRPGKVQEGKHNIAGSRTDVWFQGPDGKRWWGVQYGEWTQIIHCKRVKS